MPKKSNSKTQITESPTTEKVLVLRSCRPDLKSHHDFEWPESGDVAAPDWEPTVACGNGLHGWLWGVGDFSLKVSDPNAKWLVVEVEKESIVDLRGKVKFPRGTVIFCGGFADAFLKVRKSAPDVTGTSFAQGDSGHASAQGDSGHASAQGKYGHASAQGKYGHASAQGNSGHASAQGNSGHASAQGNSGHASAQGKYGHASAQGDYGHASAQGKYGHASAQGKYGHASAQGNSGHASAQGNSGHASAQGNSGHASAQGNSGHASAQGDSGHASAQGKYGHASAQGNSGHASAQGNSGHASAQGKYGVAALLDGEGMAKAGEDGSIIVTYWDGNRYRHLIGYVGEAGIKANVWYRVKNGHLVESQSGCDICDTPARTEEAGDD